MRLIYSVAVLALSGCATAKTITGPDGRPAYRVECNGTGKSWGDCIQKAGETCGQRGYDVLARNEEHPQSGVLIQQNDAGDVVGRTSVARDLIVRCKEQARPPA